jgi:phosphatidylglycerol:prolipoprotein diacylglycerol transferase
MDPVAFQLGPLSIRWYGILTAAGFLAGYLIASRRAPQRGVSREAIADLVFWIMVGGILGARLFYVVQNWSDFSGRLIEIIRIDHGGLVFYGGFCGACIAVAAVCRIKHLPMAAVADICAPALPVGHALGRVGCFLNGCCFGWPWRGACAVEYPHDTGVMYVQKALGLLPPQAIAATPVFPIQLVAAAMNLVIFATLLVIERRLRFRGQLFAAYLVLYGTGRFLVEFGRGDYLRCYAGLTPAQLLCFLLVAVGIVAFFLLRRKSMAAAPRMPGAAAEK